jgi:hypothetical protein
MKTTKTITASANTSIDSLKKSEHLATRLRGRILDLARKAGREGLTINEAEDQIEDYKGRSISPRFSELVRKGDLVRIPFDDDQPTRHPGVVRYMTRYDGETRRNVTVHWVPEFAPLRTDGRGNSPSETGGTSRDVEVAHV